MLSQSKLTMIYLCAAYGLLFSVQNMLAPSLTSIAEEFGFNAEERDLYLGAYLSLAFSVVGLPLSSFFAYAADRYNRKDLFVSCSYVGAAAALAMLFISGSYRLVFLWRTVHGIAVTGAIPVVYSMIADMYSADERPGVSAALSAAMGAGIIVGQIVAGFVAPTFGWRTPFLLVAVPALFASRLVSTAVSEPIRGSQEEALKELLSKGGSYSKGPSWEKFCEALRVPTNVLLLAQALPGTIPWGVIFVYLNDFLAQEKGLSVEKATALVGAFGIGAAIGGIGGGVWGSAIYKRSKALLPVLMGGTTLLGVAPMLFVIGGDLKGLPLIFSAFITALAGIFSNVNGANVRPLLLNVNTPVLRGSMIGAMTLVGNLGRGLGPWIAAAIMEQAGGREGAMKTAILAWVACAAILLGMTFTVPRDVKRMEGRMRREAEGLV